MSDQLQFTISKKFIRQSAKNSGFDFLSSIGEIIDNSISANAKSVKIRITQQNEDLSTFVIEDDGSGMDQDKMIKALSELGHEGDYNSKSISYFGSGVKFALFYLCEEGKVTYQSVRNGIQTNLWFTTDETAGFINLEQSTKTLCPNGTKVTITNVIFNLEKDIENLNRFLSVTYFPTFENNKKFQIITHNTIKPQEMAPVKFENPLYSHMTSNQYGVKYFNKLSEVAKVNNESVNISGFIYNIDAFTEDDYIEWDSAAKIKTFGRPKSHGFNGERSGVFFKCGSRFATLGNHDFLFWRNQYHTTNLRIVVDVPHTLFGKFLQLNKSKIKLSDLGLKDFKDKITKIYHEHQRSLPSEIIDIEKEENEQLVNEINGELKGNIDKNPLERADLQEIIPEAPKPEKKEHQGGTADQPFGKKRKDNYIDLKFETRGRNSPYYDACRQNKTLLIKLNSDHPFVQHYLKKPKTVQINILKDIYAEHIALCETQATEDFSMDAFYKVIQSKSDILRKLYA